jgi:hypothetical protein
MDALVLRVGMGGQPSHRAAIRSVKAPLSETMRARAWTLKTVPALRDGCALSPTRCQRWLLNSGLVLPAISVCRHYPSPIYHAFEITDIRFAGR